MNNQAKKVLLGGITSNPVFVLVLGTCPTLSISTNLKDSFWLAVSTMFVLIFSNTLISLLRKVIPEKVRIPSYILLISTLTTVVDMFLRFYLPDVHSNIGKFIALIAVNCIILGRAEGFANSNNVGMSALDGLSMGLGFLLSICLLGSLREILGAGTIYGIRLFSANYAIPFFVKTAGGFVMFGLLMGIFNKVYNYFKSKNDEKSRLIYKLEGAKND